MKSWVPYVLSGAAGLTIGVASVWLVLDNAELLGKVERDFWFGNHAVGSEDADPYTRGIIAKIGLLALNRSEAIYFHRFRDHEGLPLRESCAYELKGALLPARWWSITAYADDDFLPVNGQGAYSMDATQMVYQEGGAWTVRVAADRAGAPNWISTKNAGAYSLSLRLYNPEEAARHDVSNIDFPTITRVDCGEGPP